MSNRLIFLFFWFYVLFLDAHVCVTGCYEWLRQFSVGYLTIHVYCLVEILNEVDSLVCVLIITWFYLKLRNAMVLTQNELDYCGEEPSMSPRTPHQHQTSQPIPFTNSTFLVSSGSSGLTATAQGTRSEHCDQQPKNTVFSNALSSPIRRSLQNYHITQGGYCPQGGSPSGNGTRNNEPNFLQHHNRDPNPPSSNDSSMDI
jgi:hypothetical protein